MSLHPAHSTYFAFHSETQLQWKIPYDAQPKEIRSIFLTRNPLEMSCELFKSSCENTSAATAALNLCREYLIQTINVEIENVLVNERTEMARLNILLIRCYIREEESKHRPFWGNFDCWLERMKGMLGCSLVCEDWKRFLDDAKKKDRLMNAPPSCEPPLYTTMPLMTRLRGRQCQRERDDGASGSSVAQARHAKHSLGYILNVDDE